jgi:fluoride ion exporter CrcB/FEX
MAAPLDHRRPRGYTTFSAFSFEALALITDQRHLAAAGYVVGSVLLGVAAAAIRTALDIAIAR